MATRQGSDYWQAQVEGWRQSGLSQITYCTHHGLNIKSFRRWRTKLQRAASAASTLTLVPISVGTPITAPTIRLHSPAGWRIELPLIQTDSPWLTKLLRQLP